MAARTNTAKNSQMRRRFSVALSAAAGVGAGTFAVSSLLGFSPVGSAIAAAILSGICSSLVPLYLFPARTPAGSLQEAHRGLELGDTFIQLLQNTNEGYLLLDTWGVILDANRQMCDLFGLPHSELIGKTIYDLIDDPRLVEIQGQAEILPMNENICLDLSLNRPDGSKVDIRVSATPVLMKHGSEKRWMCFATDLTETQRIQRDLRQALKEADAASDAKATFLANMSHEIRTPMNGIMGMLEMLEDNVGKEEQARVLELIRRSSSSLLNIMDDILDYSRIESGNIALIKEDVHLENVCDDVFHQHSAAAFGSNIDLVLFFDPDLTTSILSDSLRIRQILNKLLSNAIKFSTGLNRTGVVNVRIENAADRPVEDNWLRMTITDNGIGISEEAQKRLFQPFEQEDARRAHSTRSSRSRARRGHRSHR